MDGFRETAFYLTAWHAFLATLVAVLFIVLQDFEPATALLIAANITLLFSLVLMARAGRLTDRRIMRAEFLAHAASRETPPGGSRSAHGPPGAAGDMAAVRQRSRSGRHHPLRPRLRQQQCRHDRVGEGSAEIGFDPDGRTRSRGPATAPASRCR